MAVALEIALPASLALVMPALGLALPLALVTPALGLVLPLLLPLALLALVLAGTRVQRLEQLKTRRARQPHEE